MRFLYLIFSLNRLGIFEFFHIVVSQNFNLLCMSINFFFEFKKIIIFWLSNLNLLKFFFHLSDFNVSCYNFLLKKSISFSKLSKSILDLLNFVLFLTDLLFGTLYVFDYCKVMIFCHMNHVIDVFNFFIHVYWHGGNNFFYVTGSLLVMIFHLCVFIKNSLRDGLEFNKLRLNFIFLMFELLILLFEMFNKRHKILHFEFKVHVCVIVGWFFSTRNLWEGTLSSLRNSVIAIIFVERRSHYWRRKLEFYWVLKFKLISAILIYLRNLAFYYFIFTLYIQSFWK